MCSSQRWSRPFCLRLVAASLFTAFPFTASLFTTSRANADRPVFVDGEEIFRHQWTFEEAAQIDLRNLKGADQRRQFIRLRAAKGDGLGPMFNATSCEACHANGGGAGVKHNVTLLTLDPRSAGLSTVGGVEASRKRLSRLFPGLVNANGSLNLETVLHERSTRPFYDQLRTELGRRIYGGLHEDWFVSENRTIDAIANQPVLAGRMGPIDFYLDQRNSPPLYGLGLIDKVENSRLQRVANMQRHHSDGQITGRLGIGKFGWRGQTVSLEAFVRGACANEVGLQLNGTPQPADVADETYLSAGIDLKQHEVQLLVDYVRNLPQPRQLTMLAENSAHVNEGKKLFSEIGCNYCHVQNVYPARGIYSDLLLHDMGDALQAPSAAPVLNNIATANRVRLPRFSRQSPTPSFFRSRSGYFGGSSGSPTIVAPYPLPRPEKPQFPRGSIPAELIRTQDDNKFTWDRLQREWRTPPLWGVADSGPWLHDGRAETLDAAIRWHGGEAKQVIAAYRELKTIERDKVIAFLKSLKAPQVDAPREPDETTFAKASDETVTIATGDDIFDPQR